MGLLGPALRRPQAAGARRQILQGARRRALPARRHAGRLHRPQRHDHGVPAQPGLGRHRQDGRRPVLERGQHAPLFRAPGELPSPAVLALHPEDHRLESDRARLFRLALHRKGPAQDGAGRQEPDRDHQASRAEHLQGAAQSAAAAARGTGRQARSQRLARSTSWRSREFTTRRSPPASTPATARASSCARWRRSIPTACTSSSMRSSPRCCSTIPTAPSASPTARVRGSIAPAQIRTRPPARSARCGSRARSSCRAAPSTRRSS